MEEDLIVPYLNRPLQNYMLMHRILFLLALLLTATSCNAQWDDTVAERIGRQYHIPALSYAAVTPNIIQAIGTVGVRKINTQLKSGPEDRYRIGSNTKAITGFIAAELVNKGKITWNTRFFDLFPERKAGSRKEYHHLTLLNLLSFRTKLFPYTYTDKEPTKGMFKGNAQQQRYQFAKWFLKHEPTQKKDSVCFSNLGYTAAGMMLEKASGKSYETMVAELGQDLDIDFRFGQPNFADSMQTWGHDNSLKPESPSDNYKLNWLMAAGNINVTLRDYIKFVQLNLKGLHGHSKLLSKPEFEFLHFGLNRFAIGWFNGEDEKGRYSYNIGNPGTFLSYVYIYPDSDRAYIILANVQSDEAEEGIETLLKYLKQKY